MGLMALLQPVIQERIICISEDSDLKGVLNTFYIFKIERLCQIKSRSLMLWEVPDVGHVNLTTWKDSFLKYKNHSVSMNKYI